MRQETDRSFLFREETREHRLSMHIATRTNPSFDFDLINVAQITFIVFSNRLEDTQFYLSHVFVLHRYTFRYAKRVN